jgi:arsenite methyltransferase
MAHHRDHLGNPQDLEQYLAKLDSPERDEWQQPAQVLRALELRPEMTVAEIGAGSGYFSLRLAAQVAHVFACEPDPRMMEVLRDRIARSHLRNLTPVFALPEDPLLPPASCDRILIVNAWHHFADVPVYLGRLSASLRKGGLIANVDFHEKIAREQVLDQVAKAGLSVHAEHHFLPQQHFFVVG